MTDEQTLPDTPEAENDEASGKREPPASYQRLTMFIAVLLTFSAIFTLLSSWEERIYINELNYQIISTEFNRTQATILSQAQARQNYTIYSYYMINDLLDAGIRDIPETADSLTIAQRQAEFLASNNRYFFPGRYLKPDGSYDLERNIEEEFADRGRRTSLDSASERAYITEQMERKQHYMLVTFIFGIATVVLGFEMLFYWERRSIRWVLTVTGVALFILGVINYLALSPNPLIHLNLG